MSDTLTPKERMDNLKKDTWYWIQDETSYRPIPYLYNSYGQWKLSINGTVAFINSAKMRGLFGKDCVLREVDLELDRFEPEEKIVQLTPKVLMNDKSNSFGVLMGNSFVTLVDFVAIPEQLGDFYINYNKKDA